MRWHNLLAEDDYHRRRRDWSETYPKHYRPSREIEHKFEISSWPPSNAELHSVERKILQDPEWLAYYVYFGWTSWTQITCRYWFDKHKKQITFYDVPMISEKVPSITKHLLSNPEVDHDKILVEPDRGIVVFDIHGHVLKDHSMHEGYISSIPLPRAMDMMERYVKKMFTPENLTYMTGRYYVRFGRWNTEERSQNWLATRSQGKPVFEAGVSAYHADWDMDEQRWAIADGINEDTIAGTLASLLYNPNKKIYLIQGTELDQEGADGEPLLKNVKLVKPLNAVDVYVPGVFDPREEGLDWE